MPELRRELVWSQVFKVRIGPSANKRTTFDGSLVDVNAYKFTGLSRAAGIAKTILKTSKK
ncbi:hypothetical protein NBRC116589_21680 [Ruegeria sp. HU-ET01832]